MLPSALFVLGIVGGQIAGPWCAHRLFPTPPVGVASPFLIALSSALAGPCMILLLMVPVVLTACVCYNRVTAPFIAEAVLREGFCASCVQRIRDCPVTPDGHIVCPECGAAWRAERVPHSVSSTYARA